MTDTVRLSLLGPMRIEVAGQEGVLPARKARALLAYLALRRDVSVPRETIAGLLWGDRGEDQARASLRQTLTAIRRALGADAAGMLISTNESVTLASNNLEVDVHDLADARDSNSPETLLAAAELYRGDLLEGLSVNEPAFEQWQSAQREHARSEYCRLLNRLVEKLEADRRIEDATTWCAQLLAVDPLQEPAHRRLMRLYLAQGRHDAALSQFEQCRRELADQLNVEPDKETLDLVAEIKLRRRTPASDESGGGSQESGRIAPAQKPPPGPVVPDKPSIAVLPFNNMSADPEQEFFSDGISEDIITELSRYGDLFVIARNSSFAFKGEAVDVRDIGQRLGVRYVLEGSVRKAAGRVRVTAQLIDATTAEHIWADRYDREIIDIFEIQDDLARSIVATLKGRVDSDIIRHAARKPTNSLSAYECVIKAQQHIHQYTEDDFSDARALLEKAISLDPLFARAYGWLSYVEAKAPLYWEMSAGSLDRAIEIGEQGLALDPNAMRCHLALGVAYLFNREHERAEHHFQKAFQLNPNDGFLLIELGRFKMYTNRPEEGASDVRRAMRQNPFHPNWYWNVLARCLHTAKDYSGAIAALERIENVPFWSRAYLAACHAELGHSEEAAKQVEAALQLRPDFSIARFQEVFPYRDADVLRDFFASFKRAGFPN